MSRLNKLSLEIISFLIEFLIKWKLIHYFKSIFLKSSFDIVGWLDDGTGDSFEAAAFWTDAGTNEIRDF